MTLDIEKLENHLKAELESDRLDADPATIFCAKCAAEQEADCIDSTAVD
ncbi:MAG: hypothetical protein Q8M57_03395 [Nitrosomonas sp.]|nr:hypothetical protein [Nitrosomonas sp.]MDP3280088.1 hypothetical protein [Nitrosomonas sp.]